VTVGYHQKDFTLSDPLLTLLVLKRPTGGGAVLHVDDITFSICAPSSGPFSRDILAACGTVSKIFQHAFRDCGLDVRMKGDHTAFSDVCFTRSTPVELHLGEGKIMGLALLRRKGCILLQGVIPLSVDRGLSERVFGERGEPGLKGIRDHAPGFREDEFVQHLLGAFSSQIGVSFPEGRNHDYDKDQGHEGKIDLGRHDPRDERLTDQ
jgi:lipoate-protein ligase A